MQLASTSSVVCQAGKTTRSKEIAAATTAIRLCTDEWLDAVGVSLVDYPPRFRLEPHLLKHAEQLLRAGVSVVVEFTSWTRAERDAIRSSSAPAKKKPRSTKLTSAHQPSVSTSSGIVTDCRRQS